MQNKQNSPAQLRQKLIQVCQVPREDLGVFLSDHPLVRGTVYTLRRKCSKPTCRCAQGERHASVVLTANINGKTRLWTIAPGSVEELRERTEAYRQFRKARAAFLEQWAQRQAAILRLIDAVGKARTRQP
ncbi:MAG: hypothetical protein AUJ52_07590 [Elusimicrobia bacterium CG1_02_63_36]|nr:MAG: hypothetical protein AUJ52_07590 [Elusimicrobia bacterium CG1_02_63_36]PJA14356.1 MAG: hypothetical protein COX66_12645 [Elusimicrobia bacterium CG_4_10_14_0_2_um_filter_63_34]PJB25103.1 MAG: hypothetical protein CO113_10375 [Elusimicrobia bacterium CG_4_9_14_3_um_filter_62_55]